jgi:hypothetical protein
MGIEPIDSTEDPEACSTNQSVAGFRSPCVRFACEKHRLTSQPRPMPASQRCAIVAGFAATPG